MKTAGTACASEQAGTTPGSAMAARAAQRGRPRL